MCATGREDFACLVFMLAVKVEFGCIGGTRKGCPAQGEEPNIPKRSITEIKSWANLANLTPRCKIAVLCLLHHSYHSMHRLSCRLSHPKAIHPARARTATILHFFFKHQREWIVCWCHAPLLHRPFQGSHRTNNLLVTTFTPSCNALNWDLWGIISKRNLKVTSPHQYSCEVWGDAKISYFRQGSSQGRCVEFERLLLLRHN